MTARKAQVADSVQVRLIAMSDWPEFHRWPTYDALRKYVFHAAHNGMDDFKVVKRVGRRVLIDETAFFRWVDWRDAQTRSGPK